MQLHTSELAIGGRLLDAAQEVPVAGQACGWVLVTLYAEEAVELGVALANCWDRAVKSGSLVTVSPSTETRPIPHETSILERGIVSKLTVVICLLEIHVDDSSRPDGSHILAVDGLDLSEKAGLDSVATILGEESRDRVVCKFGCSLVIARFCVRRIAAPRIDIVSPEVNGISLVGTAIEVVCKVDTDCSIIVSGVSNTNASVVLGLDVCLHVTHSRLHESRSLGVVGGVRDLVASKEAQNVCVVGHGINHRSVISEQVSRPSWSVSVDGGRGVGKILNEVNPGRVEHAHASGVVQRSINGINADDICTKLLEERDVALASGFVCEGVCKGCCARECTAGSNILLICDTTDEELGTVLVEEVRSLEAHVSTC